MRSGITAIGQSAPEPMMTPDVNSEKVATATGRTSCHCVERRFLMNCLVSRMLMSDISVCFGAGCRKSARSLPHTQLPAAGFLRRQ